jgi:hypothetical protein
MPHSSLGDGRAVRPPKSFRVSEGVRDAKVLPAGPFSRTPKGSTASQRAGLRYEGKVHDYLASQFGDAYVPSQWFSYVDGGGVRRYCQTDGLLRVGPLAVIFEVKLRFSSDAWWQLRRLYSSVVTTALRPSQLGLCLICRNYDPHMPFPEGHDVVDNVERWVIRRQFAQVGVFPWRG